MKYVVTFLITALIIGVPVHLVLMPYVDYSVGSNVIVNQLSDSNIAAVETDLFQRVRGLIPVMVVILSLFFMFLHILYDDLTRRDTKK